jgi:NitT/TauT family transport system substrate-binding protein
MQQKSFLSIMAILFLGFGLASAGELRRVRVGITDPNISVAPFYLAKAQNYYSSEGLDVDLIVMRGPVATLALLAGELEFTAIPTAGFNAALRGAPFINLLNTFQRPLFSLLTRPNIRYVTELKGKKVGIAGVGSAMETLLRLLLKKYGLEPGRDILFLVTGTGQDRLASLASGVTDATLLVPPLNFKAEDAGFREIVSFINEDIVQLQGSVIAHEHLLKSKSAVVEGFLRGTLKGFLTVRNERSQLISVFSKYARISPELAARIYDSTRAAMTVDGTISSETQRKAIEHIANLQGITSVPAAEKFFDFTLTKKIYSDLATEGWRPGR